MDGDRIEQIFQPFPSSSSSFLSLFTQVFDSMPPFSLSFSILSIILVCIWTVGTAMRNRLFNFFFFSSVMKRVKVSRETLDALLPFLVVQERNENSILGKGKIIERSCCVEQDESFRKHRYSRVRATVPGLNKSGGIVRALHRDYYYYLRLTSVQFSSVNIIKGMKRTGARGACWWWPAKKLAQRICVKLASRPNWKREIGRDRRFQSCLRSLSLSFAWLYSILRVLIPRGRELENTDNHERNEAYELKREILSLKFIKMFPVFEIGLNMWQFFFPLFFYFVSFIYL